MTFGEKLKSIREEKKMTQDDLALLLGTSKQVISRYETNQRTPKITVAIEYAEKLNIPAIYFTDNQICSIDEALASMGKSNFYCSTLEQEHIKKYRQLPETGKQAVESMMDTMLAAQPKQSDDPEKVVPLEQRSTKVTRGYAAFGGNGWQTYETETTPEKEARIERMMQELDAKKAREAAEEEERRLRIVKLHEEEEKARKKSRRGRK